MTPSDSDTSAPSALGYIPAATPAANDFVCWLWAAFPQRDGTINISRVARALGVSRSTVRRWIASGQPRLSREQQTMLTRRAILRGRGYYLWPNLDPDSRKRAHLQLAYALQCAHSIRTEPDNVPPTWRENGTLKPHTVYLLFFPRAHAYGVSSVRTGKSLGRLRRYGQIIETTEAANKYAGIALKQLTLQRVDHSRCIVPRSLVPTGRTETWLQTAGAPRLRKRIPQAATNSSG